MTTKDLHLLPTIKDSWSYLYVEHCRIDQDEKAIALHDANGKVPVPCATLALLMLGPGTNISHAAIRTLAENGCLVIWTGEQGVRLYAQGMGETRSARNLMRQARLWADPVLHLEVVMRMYRMRFEERLDPSLTLQQIRGKEGIRMREAYARASEQTGVKWEGRSYKRERWDHADPINRALSAANSCLYGVCHAAIVSAGYSPALGFIHTGKMLSFVWDIADLYKVQMTIPVAFQAVAEGVADPSASSELALSAAKGQSLEARIRHRCRDQFHESRLLPRIIPDIQRALAIKAEEVDGADFDSDAAAPGGLWDPEVGDVAGGVNAADDEAGGPQPW